jgi:hypothetical protein
LKPHEYDIYYPKHDVDDGKDMHGELMHGHQGWYTIDTNPEKHPDLVANLDKREVLDYLSATFHDVIKVIYVEGWSFHSTAFYKMAYSILKPGGVLLHTLGLNKSRGHLTELKSTILSAGFDPSQTWFLHNPIADVCYDRLALRKVYSLLPYTQRIEEIDNHDVYQRLIDTLDNTSSLKFVYKVEYATGSIPQLLNGLKRLSSIDPELGWCISFDHNRHDYAVITKSV